jgi:hypothetical protein
MNYYISTFPNQYQTIGKRTGVDYNNLIRGLLHPAKNENIKKFLPLWSPTTFEGDHRLGRKAEKIWCLVYDIDDGETQFDVWKNFKQYKLIIHTSWSHTIEHPKYRLILPLRKPIPAVDWYRAAVAAKEFWVMNAGGSLPDNLALKDKARAYYRYSIPPGREHLQRVHSTDSNCISFNLNYDHIPTKKENFYKPPKRPLSSKESILDYRIRCEIAAGIECQISGNVARKIICPQCHKRTVWFKLDVNYDSNTRESQNLDMTTARCNHLSQCGWRGTLNDLL